MKVIMKEWSSASYHGKQSDDDFQRHNAHRHNREQSGQDRFGQRAFLNGAGWELYSIEGEKKAGGELYYWLRCVGQYGPRDRQWVNAKEVIHKGNLVLA